MAKASLVEVARTTEIGDGAMIKRLAQGREVLLARVGGSYYAVDDRCPHMGGDLSAGKLEGTIITCPRHGSQFDITDGRNLRWMKGSGLMAALGKIIKSPRPLPTYRVNIDGDKILIEI
jgi:3-phenylpropionate/trans-cinnamate dioxygenase ferredoxin subunit